MAGSDRPAGGGAEKIRVVHVCDKLGIRGSRVHGVSRLFTWWLPRFDASRFEVSLVQLRAADASSEHLGSLGITAVSLAKGRFDPSTVTALRRVARERRPHILHLHGYGASNFGRVVARLERVRTILHEHAAFPEMPLYQVPLDRALAGFTDLGIAVSESTRAFMVRRRYIPRAKVEVVFNGAPLDEFKPRDGAAVAAERDRWGILPAERVVGTVGRLDEQKGNRYLIEAAGTILADSPDVKILLVGDGPLMDEHREHCRRLGIAHRVVFTGFASDIPLLQSLMDVQVFPSLWEGTPLTLFEAMSMRRPIVSTSVDGLGEVLRDRHNALLIPARDPVALAAAVGTMLRDGALAGRLADQAEADGRRYDVQRTVEALEGFYRALAPNP